jgi:hypothetical protein
MWLSEIWRIEVGLTATAPAVAALLPIGARVWRFGRPWQNCGQH